VPEGLVPASRVQKEAADGVVHALEGRAMKERRPAMATRTQKVVSFHVKGGYSF